MGMEAVARLAELLKARNAIDNIIAGQIGRPAEKGHVGEYIAAQIFGIELEFSASHKGSDGYFVAGPLACRTVNIKWHAKNDGLLDLPTAPGKGSLPDDYLVLAGPRVPALASRGTARPWVISAVFLFDARQLVGQLQAQGTKLGVATSVRRELWQAAELYPEPRNPRLLVTPEQRALLALFAPIVP